jgi:hypothetical protein
VSSKHRRKEVIRETEESAGTAENAVISNALALKGIFA